MTKMETRTFTVDDIEVRAVLKILSRPKASVDKDKWRSIKSHASFLANR